MGNLIEPPSAKTSIVQRIPKENRESALHKNPRLFSTISWRAVCRPGQ
jgi:hypothetical protein